MAHLPVMMNNSRAPLAAPFNPLEFSPRVTSKLAEPPIFLMRDDLTGLALGGNKVGQHEYDVEAAIAQVDCHGVFGQWALLKWGFTESRDQYDHSTPEIFPGVQG